MSKQKYATPGTFVPGASLARDPVTLTVLFDKKGRPLWNMPKAHGTHTTKQMTKRVVRKKEADGETRAIVVRELQDKEFPTYRGFDAVFARNARAFVKRQRRIAAEKRAERLNHPVKSIKKILGGKKNDAAASTAAED